MGGISREKIYVLNNFFKSNKILTCLWQHIVTCTGLPALYHFINLHETMWGCEMKGLVWYCACIDGCVDNL